MFSGTSLPFLASLKESLLGLYVFVDNLELF